MAHGRLFRDSRVLIASKVVGRHQLNLRHNHEGLCEGIEFIASWPVVFYAHCASLRNCIGQGIARGHDCRTSRETGVRYRALRSPDEQCSGAATGRILSISCLARHSSCNRGLGEPPAAICQSKAALAAGGGYLGLRAADGLKDPQYNAVRYPATQFDRRKASRITIRLRLAYLAFSISVHVFCCQPQNRGSTAKLGSLL